jgi:hypothetical protein
LAEQRYLSVTDMAQDDVPVKKTAARFAVLLATVTELVRAKQSKPALLDAYDDACDQIIDDLRKCNLPDTELQSIHKALARLRLALEEK